MNIVLDALRLLLFAAALGVASIEGFWGPAQGKDAEMSYGEVREFLARHTRVIELSDEAGARVAICPDWQGRVMTSTCRGLEGPSFGFVHRAFIEAGRPNPQFNNYGAEERMWLSPEGGPFSLWFKPGVEQTLANWYTPTALNEGAFDVVAEPGDRTCRLAKRMTLQNASGAEFDFEATREIRLLGDGDWSELFGATAAGWMAGAGVNKVGYETVNAIVNRGDDLDRAKGLVSIWILGMLDASPQTLIIMPYRPGDDSALGPPVKSDYFGEVPPERLRILPEAILLRADGKYRAKIGTSQRRARNVLGSIDFEGEVLTLVHFTMPDDPARFDYMNNMWQVPQPEPYVGDVANGYNDGPPEPDKPGLGAFYEIESLSPAAALKRGESLTHRHRTLHVQADPPTLGKLAKEILGVDLAEVRTTMFAP